MLNISKVTFSLEFECRMNEYSHEYLNNFKNENNVFETFSAKLIRIIASFSSLEGLGTNYNTYLAVVNPSLIICIVA